MNSGTNFRNFILIVLFTSGLKAYSTETPTNNIRKELAKCATIEGELARLDCFDHLTDRAGLTKKAKKETIKGSGKWKVSTEKNPIDDSVTAVAALTADSGASKWNHPITLILRCQSKKSDAFINWDSYLGSDQISTLVRIDNEEAKTTEWNLSTDHNAAFYPGNAALDFITSLSKAKKLVAQVTPYSESPITAIFDLNGILNAVKPLKDACNWPPFGGDNPLPDFKVQQ